MEVVKIAETTIGGWFKNAPSLSNNAKESLTKIWPWLALVFGVLQLLVALTLWRLVHVSNSLITYYGQIMNHDYGLSSTDKMIIYLSILVVLVDAVILLMAYPKLAKREKSGWDLIFLGSLLNVVFSVLNLLISGRGFGSFISSLIGSAIGFYLLFQVREKFLGAKEVKTS